MSILGGVAWEGYLTGGYVPFLQGVHSIFVGGYVPQKNTLGFIQEYF